MTREQAKAPLPIIQAWSEGKTIEFRIGPQAPWLVYDAPMCPAFSENREWRVKPAAREFWIAFGKADGLVKYIHCNRAPNFAASEDTELIHVREVIE